MWCGHTKTVADRDKDQDTDCPQRCELHSTGSGGLRPTWGGDGGRLHTDCAKRTFSFGKMGSRTKGSMKGVGTPSLVNRLLHGAAMRSGLCERHICKTGERVQAAELEH